MHENSIVISAEPQLETALCAIDMASRLILKKYYVRTDGQCYEYIICDCSREQVT